MTTEQTTPAAAIGPTQTLLVRLRLKGLSQAEICRRSGVSQPKISRWEHGEVPESVDDVFKLQKLDRETPDPPPPPPMPPAPY